MNIRDRRALHLRSREILAGQASDPKRVALVYTGITALLSLLTTVLSVMLTDRIALTGGLGNMGLRSILSTGQTILPIVQFIVSACLGFGYHFAVLKMVREKNADPGDLRMGFRHWGAVLRLMLFQAIVYTVLGLGSMYLSIYIFLATPFADPFYAVMEPLLGGTSILDPSITLDPNMVASIESTILPMFLIWGLVLLVFVVPKYYGYRMSNFCLAENPRRGALMAMTMSKRMLRRNKFALFRLDLSLWWFYLLQILISGLCYGDVLASLLGIALPFSPTFSFYFFFALSLVLQVVTYYFCINRVYVTYALAYDALLTPPEQPRENPNPPFPTEY